MTAQAQLVLDARAATGRSVQVIKPFMHSSTRPQAVSADSLGEVTLSLLLLDSWSLSCCFSPFLPSFLPSLLPSLSPFPWNELPHPLPFFFFLLFHANPQLLSSFLTHSHALAHSLLRTWKPRPCLHSESTTPPALCTLPLVSHPRSASITSSHSEAKEGMRSMDGRPELQLDTDPLRPARPPSSSPSGDANKSESDLDKLRISPRSAGLTLTDTADAGSLLESLLSAFGFWINLAGLASGVLCAIVF